MGRGRHNTHDRMTPEQKLAKTEEVWADLQHRAAVGDRAPLTALRENREDHRLKSAITDLIKSGRIIIEVFGRSWRVITILQGPHAGKKTAPPPDPRWQRHTTRDVAGAVTSKGVSLNQGRGKPSAPRFLTADELK